MKLATRREQRHALPRRVAANSMAKGAQVTDQEISDELSNPTRPRSRRPRCTFLEREWTPKASKPSTQTKLQQGWGGEEPADRGTREASDVERQESNNTLHSPPRRPSPCEQCDGHMDPLVRVTTTVQLSKLLQTGVTRNKLNADSMSFEVQEFRLEIYSPKRFTIIPGLTITNATIWEQKPSQMSKNQKSFLNYSRKFGIVSGSTGGSDDMKIA